MDDRYISHVSFHFIFFSVKFSRLVENEIGSEIGLIGLIGLIWLIEWAGRRNDEDCAQTGAVRCMGNTARGGDRERLSDLSRALFSAWMLFSWSQSGMAGWLLSMAIGVGVSTGRHRIFFRSEAPQERG